MDTESTFAALCLAVSQHSPVSVFCKQTDINDSQRKIYEAAIKFVKAYEDNYPKREGFHRKPPEGWSERKTNAYNTLRNAFLIHDNPKYVCKMAKALARICDAEEAEAMAKASDRAWSPEKHSAYHKLLGAFIAREAPETVCEAAKALAKVCAAEEFGNCDTAPAKYWTHEKVVAYNNLVDALIVCRDPEQVAQAAKALAKVYYNEFEGNPIPQSGEWYSDKYGNKYKILSVFKSLMDGTPMKPVFLLHCPTKRDTKTVEWDEFTTDFRRVDPPEGE